MASAASLEGVEDHALPVFSDHLPLHSLARLVGGARYLFKSFV